LTPQNPLAGDAGFPASIDEHSAGYQGDGYGGDKHGRDDDGDHH
jgi:hypothetical protein